MEKEDIELQELAGRISECVDVIGSGRRVAEHIGVSPTAVYQWMRGNQRPPFIELARLAKLSGKSLDWLAFGPNLSPTRHLKGVKLHKAVGNAMDAGVSIADGDSILVDENDTSIKDGKIYLFETKHGTFVKETALLPNGVALKSRNLSHETIMLDSAQLSKMKVLGRVISVQRDL